MVIMLQQSTFSDGSEGVHNNVILSDELQQSTFSDGSEGDYPTFIAVV